MKTNSNAIGVDIGYGYTKVCADKLSKAFPSQVAKTRPRGAFDTHSDAIIVNDQSFIVGDDIDNIGDYSVSTEFIGTPEYLALLGRALTMAKAPCDILVLGLPPSLYDEVRIEKLEKTISETKYQTGSGNPLPVPGIIKFIPQGAGIYFDYIWNSPQRNAQSKNGNTVVIDLGHYTLDFVLFMEGRYNAGAARSFPLGISKLLNSIKLDFAKTHGVFLNNDDNVMKLIQEGSYNHFGRTYALNIDLLMDEYMNHKLLKSIRNYASDLRESIHKSVDDVVIGRGGVHCIGQLMNQAIIIEDPQMSNARGYYQYGRRQVEASASIKTERPEPRACAAA